MATKKGKLPVIQISDEEVAEKAGTFDKGPVCEGCALWAKPRLPGRGPTAADVMLVSEAPTWTSINEKKAHFWGKGGRVIRAAWDKLSSLDPKFKALKRYDMYAVQCHVEEPKEINQGVIDRCSRYLMSEIRARKPKVVLTFGANALKATGIRPGGKFDEIRGKLLTTTVNGEKVLVIPTFSTRALLKTSGLYNLLYGDMLRAMRIASGEDQSAATATIEELSKEYVIPRTVAEVKALCDTILDYAVKDATPQSSSISVDTETNTLHSHKPDAKVLCVSFSWDQGKSCAIPLWHKDSGWTDEELEEVLGHVKRVLESPKPKVFHNLKFDYRFLALRHGLRINNLAWCSLLGEHLIREDQSGSYSLKILGRSYFPQFSNYADKIHEIATALSEEDQQITDMLDGWKKPTKKKASAIKGADPDVYDQILNKSDLVKYYHGDAKAKKKKRQDSVNYEKVPIHDLLVYAAVDTDLTRRLLRNQILRMKSENFMAEGRSLMRTHCVPASKVLGGMEHRGIRVDQEYLKFLKVELPKVVASTKAELDRHWDSAAWGEFNPNSTKQLGELLFSRGVHVGKRWNPAWGEYTPEAMQKMGSKLYLETSFDPVLDSRAAKPKDWDIRLIPGIVDMNEKSKQWKTDKKTLRALVEYTMKQGYPCLFTTALLDYRSAHKALTGFITEIENLSVLDGRLHTNFSIHGTATGRLSSSGMNLQNWATWIAGFNLKKLLIPDDPENEVILNCDAKGAEVKVFAAYSKDEQLIDALNKGMDTHCFFLEAMYGIPYAEAMAANDGVHPDPKRGKELKALRTIIKRVVFGILYGAGPRKIAETAGVSLTKAQEVIDQLFGMFPSIKQYIETTKDLIRKNSMVQTYFGRRRRFPLHNVSGFFRSQADRRGGNMLIQSTSSDIVLGQLIELDEHLHEIGGRLSLTFHDSVVAVIPKKNVSQVPDFFKYYCEDRVAQKYPWLPVKFNWDVEVGPSYGECVPVKHYIEAGNMASTLVAMPKEDQEGRLKAIKSGVDSLISEYILKDLGAEGIAAMTPEAKKGRFEATGKALHKAVMLRMGEAERQFQASHVDLEQRLEEQFDEEAMDELRDFEDANKEREGAPVAAKTVVEAA